MTPTNIKSKGSQPWKNSRKARFSELLSDLVEKPQGKPTLVPESDKRPAINTAVDDFKEN